MSEEAPYPTIIGVAAILRAADGYVFEIQKRARWTRHEDQILQVGLGCIGGKLETGESPLEALQRETLEEIGCRLVLDAPSSAPFLVHLGRGVQHLPIDEAPAGALFMWQANKPGYIEGARVAVFSGAVEGRIQPRDLPAVLDLDPDTLRQLGDGPLKVEEALARGAILREREDIPRAARLKPVGTVEVLLELKQQAPQLFDRCFEEPHS